MAGAAEGDQRVIARWWRLVMWRWMALPIGPAALASGVAGLEKAVMEKVTVASWCWLTMKASSPRSGVARQCSVGEAASAWLVDHIDDAHGAPIRIAPRPRLSTSTLPGSAAGEDAETESPARPWTCQPARASVAAVNACAPVPIVTVRCRW